MWDKHGIRIVGIDVGVSTGIVMLEIPDRVLTRETIRARSPIPYVLGLLQDFPGCHIVVEKAASFGEIKQYTRVQLLEGELSSHGFIFHEISPGEWKPIAKAQNWNFDNNQSQHESDAYCLAKYYQLFRMEKCEK